MRVGFKTSPWGRVIGKPEQVLDVIAEAGFEGVEFSQRPDALGVASSNELALMLDQRDLAYLSITNGTVQERVIFCGDNRPAYMYINHWDLGQVPALIENGHIPALHPGQFSSVRRFAEAQAIIAKHPGLRLVCDTAHLYMAGEEITQCLESCLDHIVAIHLKDWTPEFGRSGPRYGRGFTELGSGEVQLETLLQILQRSNYEGWLVVEVELRGQAPESSLLASVKWLTDVGLLRAVPDLSSQVARQGKAVYSTHSSSSESRFREQIMLASLRTLPDFYQGVAEAYNQLVPSHLVSVWAYSPAQDHMALIATAGNMDSSLVLGRTQVPHEVLSGIAVDRQAPFTAFDLTDNNPAERFGYPARKFGHPPLLTSGNIGQMISIPIFGVGGHNYARMVINLFPVVPIHEIDEALFYAYSQAVTIAADAVLDRLCSAAVTKVNILSGRCRTKAKFLDELLQLIAKAIHSQGATIFLVNESRDKLEVAASTGIRWRGGRQDQYYEKGQGITGEVWNSLQPKLTVHSPGEGNHMGLSEEAVTDEKSHSCIWVPLVDFGNAFYGVVRCRNKRTLPNMFSDEDVAILESIVQAALPHLLILIEKERQVEALKKLTHELRGPLVAIRGAAEFMMRAPGVDSFFEYDFPGDVWHWSELMARLLDNASFLRYATENMPLTVERVYLMGQVISPAVTQAGMLLREHSLPKYKIQIGDFREIPRLWVDRNQFQQVVFNLLSNAIKHSYRDAHAFHVEIEGRREDAEFVVYFRDWGPGIDPASKELIFEESFRTEDAIRRNVSGLGYGLWIVRRIIEAHEGSVSLTRNSQPTEFAIRLPRYLADQPPKLAKRRISS